MAQQNIGIGAENGGTGDSYFNAFTKTEANFTDLYGLTDALKAPTKQVVINQFSDFPTPIAGVISLEPFTKYLIGADIDIGVNTLALQDGTAVAGIESIVVALTYTGTGDMFTGDDASIKINNLRVICASGRFISWDDTLGKVLRLTDLGITCDRFALFAGLASSIRLTNVSPTTISTNGMLFTGTFLVVQYQSSLANVSAGTLIDLGSATFTAVTISNVISTIPAGATFLSGLANSGNIVALGGGSVVSTSITGVGARLNNISVDDALWQFFLNDDIADTRPDGLLAMQGNATATVIAASGTYVLIAGTWTIERTSQFTGTVAGRLTYNGGKDATVPITISVSVEPVSGASKDISIQYAKNGVLVADSQRTSRTSSGSPTSITTPWQDVLSSSDFVEFFVTNDTDTVDVLVSSAILRVN